MVYLNNFARFKVGVSTRVQIQIQQKNQSAKVPLFQLTLLSSQPQSVYNIQESNPMSSHSYLPTHHLPSSDIDHYFDSPQLEQQFHLFLESPSNEEAPHLSLSSQGRKKGKVKVQKVRKIRTNRNSQKIYHNIVKHWLIQNGFGLLAIKYNKYFHQRIYFVLVMHEIAKRIDGECFIKAYQELSGEVKKKKEREMQAAQAEVQSCEYINHLTRIIEEIDFSIAACEEFMQGNIINAITIVFKRNQRKITKLKEFKEALSIYQRVTGTAVFME